MKITARLKTSSYISIGVIILMIPALIWSNLEIKKTERNDLLVNAIQSAVFDRTILRDQYLLFREERTKKELAVKTDTLGILLQQAELQLVDQTSQRLVAEMKLLFNDVTTIFSRIVRDAETDKAKSSNSHFTNEAEKILISQRP